MNVSGILSRTVSRFKTGVALLIMSFSVMVLVSWLVDYYPLLSIIPGGATMKVNTAMIFLLSSVNLLFFSRTESSALQISRVINIGLFLLGGISIIEYHFDLPFSIDNWLVFDQYSKVNPGRMSKATAVCGMLTAMAFENASRSRSQNSLLHFASVAVITLSLISLVSYFFNVPLSNRADYFKTMAVHTSLFYLLISILIIRLGRPSKLSILTFAKKTGSRFVRQLLPVIVLLPIIIGAVVVALIRAEIIANDFGFALFTLTFILLGTLYLYRVGYRMNKIDDQRIALEEDLLESNNNLGHFKQALDRTAIVAKTDANGRIVYVNENFEQISGYTRNELMGETHSKVNSGFHPASFFDDMWATLKQGKVWTGEIRNRDSNGDIYWEQKAILPITGRKGVVQEYIAVGIDITIQKEAIDRTKSDYIKKLENKNHELEQFAYVASHDLQEPLRTISSFSEILAETYPDRLDEDGKKMLNYVQSGASRMGNLIKSLLDYSRLGQKGDIESVDLNRLCEDVKKDLGDAISSSKAILQVDNLPEVRGLRTELRMLFQNLISNAIKYTAESESPKIQISVQQKGQYWEFSIADSGIGIEDKYLSKIFVIFQRLHLRNEYEGTGIGLAHCKKIVELHGGQIWATSKLGSGSTFYFTIPIESL